MAQRPDFLYPAGSVLMHPPMQMQRVRMYGFWVRGELERLQATVDETLTSVAGGAMRFQVLSPYVLVSFAHMGHAFSTWPTDEAKGWGEETDVVTWVLVGQVNAGSRGVDAVFMYPCHIWVDDCMALINGREIYGYTKYMAECTLPPPDAPATRFAVAAKGFEPFSPESRLRMHPLLEVTATGEGPHTVLGRLDDLIEQAIELMEADLPGLLALNRQGWEDAVRLLRAHSFEQIFLKQFPDGTGRKAVYQAVVAAPVRVKAVHEVRLLGAEYQCQVHRFASFPLDRSLGLQLGAQPALLPFAVEFDFELPPAHEIHDNSRIAPEKIAVIGGGAGALTAAFFLSDEPGWQNQREITVYQPGWRLGGKGASGRNALQGQRIEEHGLHIWFGFYVNAFQVMQRAYGLLDRPPGAPLATWDEAFKPQDFITLTERVGEHWALWPIELPPMPGVPGQGTEKVDLWRLLVTAHGWLRQGVDDLVRHACPGEPPPVAGEPEAQGVAGWLHHLARHVEHDAKVLAADARVCLDALVASTLALSQVVDPQLELPRHLAALKELHGWLQRHFAERAANDTVGPLRRLFVMADLGFAILIGMLEDHVPTRGCDVLNDEEFSAWLRRHGANEVLTVNSALVRGLYDLVFAYEDGDAQRRNIEAGTMLRGLLRMAFDYRGAFMWKMQAGMGDVVFTPLYQVLKRRGVKFAFFHEVEALVPGSGDTVEQIHVRRQIDLAPGVAAYEPLVEVKGLPCWPSEPLAAQLDPAQAALLQDGMYDLDSHWSDWPERFERAFGRPLPRVTLQRGVDFDKVVFGASVASVPVLAPELVARSPALAGCVAHVKAVATQAFQAWTVPDLRGLGWQLYGEDGQEPVLTGYSEPFDTWCPMDQVLCREDWPAQSAPGNVSYFCSVLQVRDYPPAFDHGFPARMKRQVKEAAMLCLERQSQLLWPATATPHGFDWNALYDLSGGTGVHRLDSQYWRANVDPSERYVQSVVGSTRYRLATDGSGFSNLFLAGDWIRTGLNAGCVEAAVMSGMQASRAICGHPAVIAGEQDG